MCQDYFEQISLFEGLSEKQIALLSPLFEVCTQPAESILFEQGDPAENLFILVDGEVHIHYKPEDGPELTIAKVYSNGIVGWSAALGTPTYTSAAVCCCECVLLCAKGHDLRIFCERHPETGWVFLDHLATAVAERIRCTHAQVVALLEMGLRIERPDSVYSLSDSEQKTP